MDLLGTEDIVGTEDIAGTEGFVGTEGTDYSETDYSGIDNWDSVDSDYSNQGYSQGNQDQKY